MRVRLVIVGAAALAAALPSAGRLNAQGQAAFNPEARLIAAPGLRLSGSVDSNSPVVWDATTGIPQLFVMTSFAGQPSVARGSSLSRLGTARPVMIEPWPGGGVWMEAIVPDVDGTWYGYYHNEISADTACPGSDKVIPRIGAARSRDRGRTWESLGIILEAPSNTFVCSTNNTYFVNGIGDFSVQLDPDSRDLYFFFSQYERATSQQGVAVARLAWADRDEPAGKMMVWRRRIWLPAERTPTNDEGSLMFAAGVPIFPASDGWHDEGTTANAFWGPSVHWNTYLEMYVMLLSRARNTNFDTEGIYVSFSNRLDDPRLWSTPVKILNGGKWYPQVIGEEMSTGTDRTAGETARFFMSGLSEHFIRFTR